MEAETPVDDKPTPPPIEKPELLYSKGEAAMLVQMLHLAVTHPDKGGLAPVAGQGSPSVSELASVFAKRIGSVAQSLPEQAPQG